MVSPWGKSWGGTVDSLVRIYGPATYGTCVWSTIDLLLVVEPTRTVVAQFAPPATYSFSTCCIVRDLQKIPIFTVPTYTQVQLHLSVASSFILSPPLSYRCLLLPDGTSVIWIKGSRALAPEQGSRILRKEWVESAEQKGAIYIGD